MNMYKSMEHASMTNLFETEPVLMLSRGWHSADSGELCAMEMVAFLANLPHSDSPPCTCPVLGAYVRAINDHMPDGVRQTLLPILPRLIGTVNPALVAVRAEHIALATVTRIAPLALDGRIDATLVEAMRSAKTLADAARAADAAASAAADASYAAARAAAYAADAAASAAANAADAASAASAMADATRAAALAADAATRAAAYAADAAANAAALAAYAAARAAARAASAMADAAALAALAADAASAAARAADPDAVWAVAVAVLVEAIELEAMSMAFV